MMFSSTSTMKPINQIKLVISALFISFMSPLYAEEAKRIHNKGPSYSPDGSQIIFFSNKDTNNELWIMNRDGTSPVKLTEGYNNDRWPKFSPDGKTVLFMSPKADGDWDVYTINRDGSKRTKITMNDTHDLGGSFSPDGKEVVLSTFREGEEMVDTYLYSASGEQKSLLIKNAYWPSWSHDGKTIFFGRNPGVEGEWEIWQYDLHSKKENPLVKGHGFNVGGTLSPDGKHVIFGSNRSGEYKAYQINRDGSHLKPLHFQIAFDGAPSYSPDGKTLLYVNGTDKGQTIFEYDLHTKKSKAIIPAFSMGHE